MKDIITDDSTLIREWINPEYNRPVRAILGDILCSQGQQ